LNFQTNAAGTGLSWPWLRPHRISFTIADVDLALLLAIPSQRERMYVSLKEPHKNSFAINYEFDL